MRRKDYEVVADAVAALPLAPSDHAAVVSALAAAFAQENPRFDPEKFFERAKHDEDSPRHVDPSTLTRILIDYLLASAEAKEPDLLPTLSSIVDVANDSAISMPGESR
jgi:hypothetical protein